MPVPPPLSLDLRSRILKAYLAGEGYFVRLAERFGVGEASVSRIVRLHVSVRALIARV